MLDLNIQNFLIDMADWSSSVRLDSGLEMHANYFNIKNSHWEPMIEDWQCSLNVRRIGDPDTLSIV